MTPLHELRLPEKTPLIDRLLEFRDDVVGVAAFLDECEERGIDIPLLRVMPELWAYGRDLTHYLLFLHVVRSAPVWLGRDGRPIVPGAVPRTHRVDVGVEMSLSCSEPTLLVSLSHTTEAIRTRSIVHEPAAVLAHRQDGPPITIDQFRYDDRYHPPKSYAVQLMLTLRHLVNPAIDQTVHHIEKLIRQGMTDRM